MILPNINIFQKNATQEKHLIQLKEERTSLADRLKKMDALKERSIELCKNSWNKLNENHSLKTEKNTLLSVR